MVHEGREDAHCEDVGFEVCLCFTEGSDDDGKASEIGDDADEGH